jgi:hypothetical protein
MTANFVIDLLPSRSRDGGAIRQAVSICRAVSDAGDIKPFGRPLSYHDGRRPRRLDWARAFGKRAKSGSRTGIPRQHFCWLLAGPAGRLQSERRWKLQGISEVLIGNVRFDERFILFQDYAFIFLSLVIDEFSDQNLQK